MLCVLPHIKRTVQVLSISKVSQKIAFQVRHPENAKTLLGIYVTTTLSRAIKTDARITVAGNLSLARPGKGDVIYTQDVKVDNNQTNDQTTNASGALADDEHFTRNGTQRSFYETNLCIHDAIWDGLYDDIYLSYASMLKEAPYYKITLYLIYELYPERHDC